MKILKFLEIHSIKTATWMLVKENLSDANLLVTEIKNTMYNQVILPQWLLHLHLDSNQLKVSLPPNWSYPSFSDGFSNFLWFSYCDFSRVNHKKKKTRVFRGFFTNSTYIIFKIPHRNYHFRNPWICKNPGIHPSYHFFI